MDALFGLLGQVIESILSVIPRMVIVRATHRGIKWVMGAQAKAVEPGITVYWPLVTDMEVQVVARQTADIPNQVLTTQDRKQVVVGSFLVFGINDIVQALGERNWDVESTVRDITQGAIVEEITKRTLDELLNGVAGGRDSEFHIELTENCRKQLRQFGVYVHRAGITDCAVCKVHKILGSEVSTRWNEGE